MIEDALLILNPLDRHALLNLVQYTLSRCLSIALTYVTNHSRFSDHQKDEYLSHLSNELVSHFLLIPAINTDRIS
jgi:hypothetical protein